MFTDVEDLVPTTASPASERHGAAKDPTRPPPGAAADWTVPQNWEALGAEEHAVWDLLFARQQKALAGRAVNAFEQGLEVLRLGHPGVPEFGELNERLFARTGWTVVAVPGLVPDDVFFEHLSHRRFPAGNFIRKRSQLDYLEEPDVFHDVFGHVPLLANPDGRRFHAGARRARPRRRWRRARCTGWRGSTGTRSSSASPARTASSRSTAPASSRASARAASRSKARSRTGSPSISTACCAPHIAPTASRRAIS